MSRRLLILDACVLIDYCEADISVLRVISRAVGPVHVPSTLLEKEVDQLDASSAESHGIRVVEPSFAMLTEARRKRGGLSARDHLCLLMAKTEGWTCVTNDKALRNCCIRESVDVLWGLEMMGLAVQAGDLPPDEAEQVAKRIAEVNATITAEVVERFLSKFVRQS